MKKSVFSVSLLVAGLAFAGTTEVTNDYVLGVMPVALDAGQEEAIIGIPWIEAGQVSEGIAVSNIVKTANLNVGDMLSWYNTSTTRWEFWRLSSGTGGTNYWQSVISMEGSGFSDTSASSTVLKRGQAILLTRKSESKPATSIYVVGQYSAAATETLTMALGKVTMIAPPRDTATDLNSAVWANVGANDMIFIRAGNGGLVKTFRWNDGKWGYDTVENMEITFNNTAIVPLGCGAFYKSASTTGTAPTMTWAAAN